ncbi:MAG TPA: hypothetical protein VGD39_07120, partial [Nocardioides sp.]
MARVLGSRALGSRVRRGAALVVLACGTLGLGAVTAPAQAGGALCGNGVVFDEAGVLDDRKVSQAARSEFGDEVTVKVIAWEQTPGNGTLYDALLDARRQCGGWGFTGGGGRSLLVLGVSVGGRELGSHYDGRAFSRFDAARDGVEVDGMGTSFGNGQWTDGMLAGLRGYGDAYDGPQPTYDPDAYDPGDFDPGDFAVDDTGTSGSDALPWVLGVPVGLAAV